MVKICGRCGKPTTFLDILTYAPNNFAKHTAFCPPGWMYLDWRNMLKGA